MADHETRPAVSTGRQPRETSVSDRAGFSRRQLLGLVLNSPLLAAGTAPVNAQTFDELRLITELPGGNVHPERSRLTQSNGERPRVTIEIRNPEGGLPMWQAFRFALAHSKGRTIDIEIPLAGKEGGATYRRAWSGPYVSDRYDDHAAWWPVPWAVTSGVLHFSVDGRMGDRLYVASMPPNALPQCESWLRSLQASHGEWIHDDLPSRMAARLGPFSCGIAPAARDEMGRRIESQPLLGFRIGNDTSGQRLAKRRFAVFAGVHPGEDHGPLQLRGFVYEWLNHAELAPLRDSTDLIVYPMVAANGMHAGYRRFEPRINLSSGDDLNQSFLGPTQNGTALAWRRILEQDLDANLTSGGLDFHDVSPGSELAWAYHPRNTPAATLDAVKASHPRINFLPSNAGNTTMAWLRRNTRAGLNGTALTAEVSDEAGSMVDYLRVGRRWAWVCKTWLNSGLLGP